MLKIAIQKSGRLAESSLALLEKCGFEFEMSKRGLSARVNNFPLEILFFRTGDIPEVVNDFVVDIGICGENSIIEKKFSKNNLEVIEKFDFGKCRLSIAAPQKIQLKNKKIATSYPETLEKYLKKNKIKAEIVKLSGSVEIAPKLKLADAICDLVSTGSTLRTHGLQELVTILESQAVLIINKKLAKKEKEIFNKFLDRIRAVIRAQKYKYILMNAPRDSLDDIRKLIPGLKNPTISPLADSQFVSIASVVEESKFWDTIEKLKSCGASGILVVPIEKMIL